MFFFYCYGTIWKRVRIETFNKQIMNLQHFSDIMRFQFFFCFFTTFSIRKQNYFYRFIIMTVTMMRGVYNNDMMSSSFSIFFCDDEDVFVTKWRWAIFVDMGD